MKTKNSMNFTELPLMLPMKKLSFCLASYILATSSMTALAQSVVDPAPTYPMCSYRSTKGTQKKFPCRVIANGKDGEVIFIDEYAGRSLNSRMVSRHDGKQGWYAPVMRKNECLLRKQGAEYICIGKSWSGI